MLRPVANPEAFIACIQAVADIQDRRTEEAPRPRGFVRRNDERDARMAEMFAGGSELHEIAEAFGVTMGAVRHVLVRLGVWRVTHKVANPAKHYDFTAYEHQLYGILRAKHGMTKAQASEAVLRSRRASAQTGKL